MDFEGVDQDITYMTEQPEMLLPSFKSPLKFKSSSDPDDNSINVFEIDGSSSKMLEDDEYDDDEGEAIEEEEIPVTEWDPKAYYTPMRKTRALIESYGINPEVNFKSFCDLAWFMQMETINEEGSVKKTIIQKGTGPLVPDNCNVFVHYIMCGEGIDDPFDSTVNRGYPCRLDLRTNDAIPGINTAIRSMHLKEVAKVWIRQDMAYGEHGCPPRIHPYMNWYCIIEVLDIIEEDKLKLVPFMSTAERQLLDFDEINDAVRKLRQNANAEYIDSHYWRAVKKYRRAIDIFEDYSTMDQIQHDKRSTVLHTLYMNLAASYLKVRRPKQVCTAIKLALRCLEYREASAKLYYRFAEAKLMLGGTEDARNLNQKAIKLGGPDQAELNNQKKRIELQLKQEETIRDNLYKQMGQQYFGSLNKESSEHQKTTPSNHREMPKPKPNPSLLKNKATKSSSLKKTREMIKPLFNPTTTLPQKATKFSSTSTKEIENAHAVSKIKTNKEKLEKQIMEKIALKEKFDKGNEEIDKVRLKLEKALMSI